MEFTTDKHSKNHKQNRYEETNKQRIQTHPGFFKMVRPLKHAVQKYGHLHMIDIGHFQCGEMTMTANTDLEDQEKYMVQLNELI